MGAPNQMTAQTPGDPMKRYDLITNYRCGSSIEEMEPADEGEWVRWESVASRLEALEAERNALRAEVELLTKSGIIEVAVRNPSVADYMNHWEGCTERAEAQVAALRSVLETRGQHAKECGTRREQRKPVEFYASQWASEDSHGWGVYCSHDSGQGRGGGIVKDTQGSHGDAIYLAARMQAEWDKDHPDNVVPSCACTCGLSALLTPETGR